MSKKLDALVKKLETTPVAIIHAAFDETPHTVAMIDMPKTLSTDEMLEKAFMLTNSIESAWWTNKGVTKMFNGKSCRSTSVGDMVLIGNEKYKCEAAGWSKLAWTKPAHEWNKVSHHEPKVHGHGRWN